MNKRFRTYELFTISSDTPFRKRDVKQLKRNPEKVILKYFPESEAIYRNNHWTFPETIDRVYAIDKAKKILKYSPKYNFIEFISAD